MLLTWSVASIFGLAMWQEIRFHGPRFDEGSVFVEAQVIGALISTMLVLLLPVSGIVWAQWRGKLRRAWAAAILVLVMLLAALVPIGIQHRAQPKFVQYMQTLFVVGHM